MSRMWRLCGRHHRGQAATQVIQGEETVRSGGPHAAEFREDQQQIGNLLVPTPAGSDSPAELADIHRPAAPSFIYGGQFALYRRAVQRGRGETAKRRTRRPASHRQIHQIPPARLTVLRGEAEYSELGEARAPDGSFGRWLC